MATIEPRRLTDGTRSYRVKIRLKGHPPQYASFARLTDAKRWEQSTEAAIREGRHFKTNEAKKHTLADAMQRYQLEVMPHKPGSNSQTQQINWWKKAAGSYRLADVTPALIGEYRDKLLNTPKLSRKKNASGATTIKKRSPSTVVRYLALLSHVFTVAVKEWGWLEENPVAKVRKPKEPKGRERYLSDDERDRLVSACRQSESSCLYPVVVLALSTGMRRGEILTLRWNQVDFKNTRITLIKTKNGERRALPLVGLAHTLLLAHSKVRSITNDMVFPGGTNRKPIELTKAWYTALKVAAIQDFRFHDLRHSAASYLAMNGATTLEIAAVLGHKTLAMVKRYSHLSDAHSQRVIQSMNAKIFATQNSEGEKHHG